MRTKKTSGLYRLNLEDIGKGFLTAFIGALVTGLLTVLNDGGALPTVDEWKSIGVVALISGLSYLTKNFFTPEKTILKTVLLFVVLSVGLSSCAFMHDVQKRSLVEVTQKPSNLNDTIAIDFSFWDFGTLVQEYVPSNSKFGNFVAQSTRHCSIQLTSIPENINDTTTIRLMCDSTFAKVQGWFPRKK